MKNFFLIVTTLALSLVIITGCGDDDSVSCLLNDTDNPAALYAIESFIDVGGKTEDLAFDGKGNLFAGMIRDSKIIKISGITGVVEDFATDLSDPCGIAFDPSGNLWVCEYSSGELTKLSPEGVELEVFTSADSTDFVNPNHVAVTSSGNVYMSDSAGFVVKVSDGTASMFFDPTEEYSVASPNGIAVSSDETKLYINDLNANGGTIWEVEIDSSGDFISAEHLSLSKKVVFADGIVFDQNGLLYITYGGTSVKVATVDISSGEVTDIYTGSDMQTPANLQFGYGACFSSQKIYIAQLGLIGSPTEIMSIYVGVEGMPLPTF